MPVLVVLVVLVVLREISIGARGRGFLTVALRQPVPSITCSGESWALRPSSV